MEIKNYLVEQQVEDYLSGLNPPVAILEEELINSVVKSFIVEYVEEM